uniref:(northern house mosquito) hypothetical protein n=1 Tax=Culex pipiens TaxID=7175 RepID=A0A8D8KNT5_CULPI
MYTTLASPGDLDADFGGRPGRPGGRPGPRLGVLLIIPVFGEYPGCRPRFRLTTTSSEPAPLDSFFGRRPRLLGVFLIFVLDGSKLSSDVTGSDSTSDWDTLYSSSSCGSSSSSSPSDMGQFTMTKSVVRRDLL